MKTADQYYVLYPNALKATDRTVVQKVSILLAEVIIVDAFQDLKAMAEVDELTGGQIMITLAQTRDIWEDIRKRQIEENCKFLIGENVMNYFSLSLENALLKYVKKEEKIVDVECKDTLEDSSQDLQPTE